MATARVGTGRLTLLVSLLNVASLGAATAQICARVKPCCHHRCTEYYPPPHQHDCRKSECVSCIEEYPCPAVTMQAAPQTDSLLVLESSKLTLSGTLHRSLAIGGESTGWELALDSAMTFSGVRLKALEVDPQKQDLTNWDGKRVQVDGQVTWRVTTERHVRPILIVDHWRILRRGK